MTEEPQFDNWKDAWEYQAKKTSNYLMTLSEDQLADHIKHNETDAFYQIWRAIGEKGTMKSALVLWQYLKDNGGGENYLDRAHCAEALCKIMGKPDPELKIELHWRVVNSKDGEKKRQAALEELRDEIEERSKQ